MRVFLIAGKGNSGKNTTAEIIKDYYAKKNIETVITSISKYIKMYATEISNWDGIDEDKPRALLQMIGSKVREEMGDKFFVRRLVEDLSFYKLNYENIVVSDVRLPFEIEYFQEVLGDMVYTIRVTRDDYVSNLKEEEKNHETEVALDTYNRFDYEITNSDLVSLKKEVEKVLERIDGNE